MIQRVQSVWLFLASLTLFLCLILPILTKQGPSGDFAIFAGGLYHKVNNVPQKLESYTALFGGVIAACLLCLINIFIFRNRTLQKRIIIISIVLILVVAGILATYALKIPGGIAGATISAGAYMPVLSILFCTLAFRGIRKDEQLIRSADRLR